jgi:hypothetical protein
MYEAGCLEPFLASARERPALSGLGAAGPVTALTPHSSTRHAGLKTGAHQFDARANNASAEVPRQFTFEVCDKAGGPRKPTIGSAHAGRIALSGGGPRGWRPVIV